MTKRNFLNPKNIFAFTFLTWSIASFAQCPSPDLNQGIHYKTGVAQNPFVTHATFYNPGGGGIEGGKSTSRSELAQNFRHAVSHGLPVTVAMDQVTSKANSAEINFVDRCGNKFRETRCLLLVHVRGLWNTLKSYGVDMEKKFHHKLPKDFFLALTEDTGPNFYGKGRSRIDIATINQKMATQGMDTARTTDVFELNGLGMQNLKSASPQQRKCFWQKLRKTDLALTKIQWASFKFKSIDSFQARRLAAFDFLNPQNLFSENSLNSPSKL